MERTKSRGRSARIIWGMLTGGLALGLMLSGLQVRRIASQNRSLLLQNDSLLSANLLLQRTLSDTMRTASNSGVR